MNEQYYIQFGTTRFFVPHLHDWSKKQFFDTYRGLVSFDLDNAWNRIQDRLKELGMSENPKYSGKPKKVKKAKE